MAAITTIGLRSRLPAPPGMDPYTLVAYGNQPILQRDGRHFTPHRNFVDFLAELTASSRAHRLILPVGDGDDGALARSTPLDLPGGQLVAVRPYAGHLQALGATLANALTIRDVVRRSEGPRPTVFMAAGPSSMLAAQARLLPRSTPFVVFVRGDTVATLRHYYRNPILSAAAAGVAGAFRRSIDRLQREGRALVLCFGEHLAADYRRHGEHVGTVAALIEDGMIVARPPRRDPARKGLRLVFVGRLSHEKGVIPLLDAIDALAGEDVDVALTVVGHGPLEAVVRERAAASGGCVHFEGHLPPGEAVAALLDVHDALVLPSRTEGVPRVVAEAFGRGLPVLATEVGALPHMFRREIHFIEGPDAGSIARAARWAAQHRDTGLRELGERGHRRAPELTLASNVRHVRERIAAWLAER